jgi:hypothetical protein
MGIRRRKKQSGLYVIFMMISSSFAFVIYLFASLIKLIVRIIGSKPIASDLAIEKGFYAEEQINTLINKYLKNTDGRLYADFIIGEDDKSTQIDHLIITSNCLFVIETKNYSVEIFGDTRDNFWYRKKNRESYEFQNPFKQNDLHIQRIQELIEESSEFDIFNIVCFFENEGLNLHNILKKNEDYILTTSSNLIRTIELIEKSYEDTSGEKTSNMSRIVNLDKINRFVRALDDVIVIDSDEINNHIKRLKLKELKKNHNK